MRKRSKKKTKTRFCEQMNKIYSACLYDTIGNMGNGSLHFDALIIYGVSKC